MLNHPYRPSRSPPHSVESQPPRSMFRRRRFVEYLHALVLTLLGARWLDYFGDLNGLLLLRPTSCAPTGHSLLRSRQPSRSPSRSIECQPPRSMFRRRRFVEYLRALVLTLLGARWLECFGDLNGLLLDRGFLSTRPFR